MILIRFDYGKESMDEMLKKFLDRVSTSSKCQQKVEIFIGQPKSEQKSAISSQGQQFLQLSQKGTPKSNIC